MMKEKVRVSTGECRLSAVISRGITQLASEERLRKAQEAAQVVSTFNSIKNKQVDFQRRYR